MAEVTKEQDKTVACKDCGYQVEVETALKYEGLRAQCHEANYGAETMAELRIDENGNEYWNC